MSYQVLARKWRPHTFDEVTGQAHVTTPLRNAIRSGRIPHAILLTGPRGTGKTTLARIFACCLNADGGPSDSPARDNPACLEIQSGSSTDVQEIDAASRTSVDDVREIIESIRYAAAPGKWRIFIVDEVHMLSTPAFNALLKTLEEPPPKSLFLFCTTNPEKIPFTVTSRCQRYDLRRIPTAEVTARLAEIAEAESVEVSRASLLEVARAGDGSLRDALTLLDQLIASGGGKVEDERVAELLDLIDRRVLHEIARACMAGESAAALSACRNAWQSGADARRLGAALLGVLRDLVVLQVAPQQNLVEAADDELQALRALSESAEPARLRRMFRALLREQEDLAWAPDPFAVLEMAVLRLASLPPGDQVETLLNRLDALEQQLQGAPPRGGAPSGGAKPAQRGARNPGGARSAAKRSSTDAAGANAGAANAAANTAANMAANSAPPHAATSPAPPPPAAASPAPPTHASAPPAQTPPAADAPLAEVFAQFCSFAQRENRGLFAALEGGSLLARGEGVLRIALPSELAVRRLEQRAREFGAVCARFFGEPLRTHFEWAGENAAQKPANHTARENAARENGEWKRRALDNPAVNDAAEIFGASIRDIRPLAPPGENP